MMSEPGKPKVTLYEVSKRAGVSIATVSRVINNSAKVRRDTREKVKGVMRQLGFRPSHAARTLAGHQTHTIGVIFPDIASGFYAQVLKGIDRALADYNYHALITFSHTAEDKRTLTHRVLNEQRTDALILMNLAPADRFLDELLEADLPIILLDRPSPLHKVSSVSINNEQGMVQVLRYLSETGHRRIGMITGPKGTYDADSRLLACLRHAPHYRLDVDDTFVGDGGFAHNTADELMTRWIRSNRPLPDAIVVHNDVMAVGCINACRRLGMDVPGDLGIIGFDDIECAELIGLTTVRVPFEELGRRAADLAVAACQDPADPQNVQLNTSLVVRTSCRSHPASDGSSTMAPH